MSQKEAIVPNEVTQLPPEDKGADEAQLKRLHKMLADDYEAIFNGEKPKLKPQDRATLVRFLQQEKVVANKSKQVDAFGDLKEARDRAAAAARRTNFEEENA